MDMIPFESKAQIKMPPKTKISHSLWIDAWHQFRRCHLALLGSLILIILVLCTLLGPLIWHIQADYIDLAQVMKGPSTLHPMGTDDLGRDIFSRALLGGRISIAVAVTTTTISLLMGTLIGVFSGFFGGLVDSFLMRMTDLFISLPQLPLLLLVIFLFRDTLRKIVGPELGIFLLIVALIGGLTWMPTARIVRAECRHLKQQEFVEAAIALGASNSRLMFRHILPNTISPLIVSAILSIGSAIITESTLSFLGLGFPPDVPTWGRMLYDSYNYLEIAPHMALFPGALIFVTVLSINYVGDGLHNISNPKSRH